MNPFRDPLLALIGAALLLGACGGKQVDGGAGTPGAGEAGAVVMTEAARKEARTLFDTLCATCHGTTGHGDGPASAGLDPKPRSFGDKTWQASVDDTHIRRVITLGGAAVQKSPNMPPQPQLKSQPAVLQGLVEIVRSYGN